MTFQDSYAAKFAAESNWGHFLDHPVPLAEREDPSALLPWKGMTLQHRTTTAIDTTWNEIAARINVFPYPTSDAAKSTTKTFMHSCGSIETLSTVSSSAVYSTAG
jgi:hypothetical protein